MRTTLIYTIRSSIYIIMSSNTQVVDSSVESQTPDLHENHENDTNESNEATNNVVNALVSTEEQCQKLLELVANAQKILIETKKQMSSVIKSHKLEMKKHKKHHKTNTSGVKRESGFNKPGPVPKAFIELLNLQADEQLPRTNITKLIYGYIKTNNLYKDKEADQDKADKRNMAPNDALKKAFDLSDDDSLTFYTIQKFIKNVYNKEFGANPDHDDDVEHDEEHEEVTTPVAPVAPVAQVAPVVAAPVVVQTSAPVVAAAQDSAKPAKKPKAPKQATATA